MLKNIYYPIYTTDTTMLYCDYTSNASRRRAGCHSSVAEVGDGAEFSYAPPDTV